MRNSIWRRTDGQTQGQVQVLSCAFAAKNFYKSKSAHLWTEAPGLVGGDHHIGGHEEGAILRRGHHVVSLVPDPLI